MRAALLRCHDEKLTQSLSVPRPAKNTYVSFERAPPNDPKAVRLAPTTKIPLAAMLDEMGTEDRARAAGDAILMCVKKSGRREKKRGQIVFLENEQPISLICTVPCVKQNTPIVRATHTR